MNLIYVAPREDLDIVSACGLVLRHVPSFPLDALMHTYSLATNSSKVVAMALSPTGWGVYGRFGSKKEGRVGTALPPPLGSLVGGCSLVCELPKVLFYLIKHPRDACLAELYPSGPFPCLLEPGDVLTGVGLQLLQLLPCDQPHPDHSVLGSNPDCPKWTTSPWALVMWL